MQNQSAKNFEKKRILVLWQSLVVESYRGFFEALSDKSNFHISLIAPQKFKELGYQEIICTPWKQTDVSKSQENKTITLHALKVFYVHVQFVFFIGLSKICRNFFSSSTDVEKKICLLMAEPYSLTALLAYLQCRMFCSKGKFVFYSAQNIDKHFFFLIRCIEKYIYSKSAAILSIGEEQTSLLRRRGYRGKIVPFPLWYNDSIFFLKTPVYKKESTVIAYVGSFLPEKGVLDIFTSIKKHVTSWEEKREFVLVGSGPLQSEISKNILEIEQLNVKCRMLGKMQQKELADVLSNTDILIVPSITTSHWKEQFGRIIIEAWGCGAIVIGSKSGSIANLIDDEKFLFQEKDHEDMEKCLALAVKMLSEKTNSEIRFAMNQKALKFSQGELAKIFASRLSEI